jgi:hypothetical protein
MSTPSTLSTPKRGLSRIFIIAAIWLIALALHALLPLRAAAQVEREQLTVYVSEIQTLTPGFAMGNIVLADPKIAGYEPTAGRRELMIRGKKVGTTTLNIWDQKGALRRELTLVVTTREAASAEGDLKALLKDYPSVEVQRLGGGLIVTGAVSSKDDLTAIEKIAAAGKAKSVVRYVPPGSGVATGPVATTPPATTPGATTTAPTATSTAPGPIAMPTAPGMTQIEYEIELLEASTQFTTGSYARGIEPSGRSMYKGTVRAGIGQSGTVFIGGKALSPPPDPKKKPKKGEPEPAQVEGAETGIRLTVQPNTPGTSGSFKTDVLVETNVPLNYDLYDPDSWRRSRWSFAAKPGEPFGLSGNDLLAAPQIAGGSKIGTATRTATTATRIPGVAGAPGVDYVPVFGSLFRSTAYKKKQTQLLVVLRPRLVPVAPPQ